jgi:hypothetical protein
MPGRNNQLACVMAKSRTLQIGQKQAKRICQMSSADRLAFIAEGLPIILASAQGFWAASLKLQTMPREAEVLRGFAKEEAAKILILIDVVRCPQNLLAEKLAVIVGRFYGHLDRLIYAQMSEWWCEDVTRLRKMVEPLRQTHYLEGNMGEYILPNSAVYQRESKLYADIEAYEDGAPLWNAPVVHASGLPSMMPSVLAVVEAMSACGMLTLAGLTAVADIWSQLEFVEGESLQDAERLTRQLLDRVIAENLPAESATQEHVNALYQHWPLPMYNVDLTPISMTLEELKAEQDRLLWAESGGS